MEQDLIGTRIGETTGNMGRHANPALTGKSHDGYPLSPLADLTAGHKRLAGRMRAYGLGPHTILQGQEQP